MDNKLMKQITETKYLSAENAWRYRAIMRCFYLNDQKFKHWMNKEEVYDSIIKSPVFSDYSIEMCKQDLDALTEWKNLSAVQDTSKVTSYQQFVNKQYRYQMTEYAIEIERMSIRLENLFIEGGSLEPTLLERIKEELIKFPDILQKDMRSIGGWWSQMTNDFLRLNQNYQDHIRDWNSLKADELMKSKSFLMYKEKLVDYLRHFIKELQHHVYDIEKIIKSYETQALNLLFEKIAAYELSIPRLDLEPISLEVLLGNIKDKYQNIYRFFINGSDQKSEVENILAMTNEIIRKITRYAANILEMSSQYSSRKEEYIKVAQLFSKTKNIEEAHKLSAQVFGIDAYVHIAGDMVRETESITSSMFDEMPLQVVFTPRVRTYREKIKKTAIIDHKEDKKRMLEKVLEEKRLEEEVLMSYLDTGRVVFELLSDIPEQVRRALLRWLVKGIREKGDYTVTEHGKRFRVLNPKETRTCTISCEDGLLKIPAYILEFEGEK